MPSTSAAENIDHLIQQLGGCGLFQVLVGAVNLLAEDAFIWSMLAMVVGSYNPGWKCLPSERQGLSSAFPTTVNTSTVSGDLRNGTTPSYSIQLENGTSFGNLTPGPNHDLTCAEFHKCVEGIQFNAGETTVVTEWTLICDRAWITSLIISLQMVGIFVGVQCSGHLADRFGRKPVLLVGMIFGALINLLAGFATSWEVFAGARFLIGMTIGFVFSVSYVLGNEFLSPWGRGVVSALPDWAFSASIFAMVAMVLGNWRYIQLATAVVSALTCVPYLLAPESMRWLVIQGQFKRANKIIATIARINRTPVPNIEIFHRLRALRRQLEKENKKTSCSYLSLFQQGLHKATIVMGLVWFCWSTVFYALTFGIKALTGNLYINMLLVEVIKLPIYFLAMWSVNRLGRRLTTLSIMVVVAASSAGIVIVQLAARDDHRDLATTALAILTSSVLGCGWNVCQSWVIELYPTTVRALSFSWCHSMARLGGILAPFLIPQNALPLFAAFLIMNILLVVALISLCLLPETRNEPLTDVMHEDRLAADLYDSAPVFSEYYAANAVNDTMIAQTEDIEFIARSDHNDDAENDELGSQKNSPCGAKELKDVQI